MRRVFLAVFIFFYSILFELAGFVASLLGLLIKNSSQWHIGQRRSLPGKIRECGNEVMWLHAASLGEAKVLLTILPILLKKYPGCSFVLTAVTESGVSYLKNNKTERVCGIGYLPLDSLFRMEKMITHYGISRVWLIETEIWPAMLWVCLTHNIRVGIINARIEESSFRIYAFFRWILNPFFENMAPVLAQDDHYVRRFKKVGVNKDAVHCVGNIKSYVSITTPPLEKKTLIRKNMGLRKKDRVITIGCLHPDEVFVIRDAIAILLDRGYAWKWIVVPRHLNKSGIIKSELGEKVLLTQEVTGLPSGWNICVVDRFGVLEDMYMAADAAIIGGTFNRVGGHNVWEAVQYAIPVFIGPDYHTQKESCRRVLEAGVAFSVSDAQELAEKMTAVLTGNNKDFMTKMAEFKEIMDDQFNSLEAYI